MALPGLVAAKNLSDVANREFAWNNLGNGFSFTISGITTEGVVVRGKDILALEGARNASTRDFVFIKGLTALSQPRIRSAAIIASSGTFLRDNALLKASPFSTGDYSVSRGILDANSLRVNNLEVASISETPFSGDTALAPLEISIFSLPSNFQFTEFMPSGSISAPDRAIPVETDAFILYAKAGQN